LRRAAARLAGAPRRAAARLAGADLPGAGGFPGAGGAGGFPGAGSRGAGGRERVTPASAGTPVALFMIV